jgi:sec-independent protein translocase protein TatC
MALVPFPSKAQQAAELEPDWDEQDPEPEEGGKMTFLEHLDELRRRIIYALVSVLAGFLVAFYFHNEIFDFVYRPMQQLLPQGQTLIYTDPAEGFILHIKLALIVGLLLASPAVMTQVWLFVAPGLYAHEKKWAIPFVLMSSFFFVVGAAFSHYVVFPLTWTFFASWANDIVTFMPRVEPTFSIYMRLILAFGIVFQMPTLVLFLARMGVLTARFLIRNVKYAFLLIVIISAVVTPDGGGVSLVAMAGPMTLLYGLSIILAWIFGKRKPAEEAA